MKKIIIIYIFCIVQVYGLSATTKNGYISCLTKEWLDDILEFSSQNDPISIQKYTNSEYCIQLKEGLKVRVLESPGMFGGVVKFTVSGIKLYSVREALKYR